MRGVLRTVVAAALAVAAGASSAQAQKDKDMLVVGASLFTDSIAPTGGAYITLSLCYHQAGSPGPSEGAIRLSG